MPNLNYQRGSRAEYRLKKQLEGEGWFVIRSAGSHGPVDLVAINKEGILLLQVKSEVGDPGDYREDLHKLAEVQIPYNGCKELRIWRGKKWMTLSI